MNLSQGRLWVIVSLIQPENEDDEAFQDALDDLKEVLTRSMSKVLTGNRNHKEVIREVNTGF